MRYPGGKQRAAKLIANYFAENTSIASLFLGGGAVELELASHNKHVTTTDLFDPLISFWHHLDTNLSNLLERSAAELGLDKTRFKTLQTELRDLTATSPAPSFEKAWRFFVLNRASFSGTTLAGGMSSGQRFTQSSLERLTQVDLTNLNIIHGDYYDALLNTPEFPKFDAIYADPPYALEKGGKLYGDRGDLHTTFDHTLFAARMEKYRQTPLKIVISYNDTPQIRDLYTSWNVQPVTWAYGMNKSKKSNEILITNAL